MLCDPDGFHLEEFLDRFLPAFPTLTRTLVSAEGTHEAHGPVGIHPDGSGFEFFGHPQGSSDVTGPNSGSQTENDVVSYGNRLVFILKRNDG